MMALRGPFLFPGSREVASSPRDTARSVVTLRQLWPQIPSVLSSTQLYLVTELMFPETAPHRDFSSSSSEGWVLRKLKALGVEGTIFMDLINVGFTRVSLLSDLVTGNHHLSLNIFSIN